MHAQTGAGSPTQILDPRLTEPKARYATLEPPATDRAEPATFSPFRVSVVVCAYTARRLPVLRSAVAAAREQLTDADELILVIDHNPELLAIARDAFPASDRDVRVIPNGNARGLSGARNAGVEAARAELVAFLDDDAVPSENWLERLIEPFDDPRVIGTGGVASPEWEDEQPGWMPDEFLWVVGCSYRGLPTLRTPIRNPIGANMAFRRSAIQSAGGFADGIGRIGRTPLGCEETELSIRATRATDGWIVQQPSASVGHLVPADRARIGYFVRRCWAEGLSKAHVARLAGEDAALSSERRYATRTLPAGVLAGVRAGFRGDLSGFGRAAAIAGGFAVTVAGYLRGLAGSLPGRLRHSGG